MPANVNFDFTTQTPPTLPSGCNNTSGTVVTASSVLDITVAAAKATAYDAASVATFSGGSQDGNGGLSKTLVTFGCTTIVDSFQGLIVTWRSSTDILPTQGTCNELVIEMGASQAITWSKVVSGSVTQIGTSAATYIATHRYTITIDHSMAGSPVFTLFDITANQYWNGTAWQSGSTTFTLGSDTTITGQGYNNCSIFGASFTTRVTDYQVIVSSASTTYTLTAPSPATAKAGIASGNFSIQANNSGPSGSVTITPSDNGAGGTFSPTSITITANDTTVHTFTHTSSNTGSVNINTTNNGSLTDPSAVTITNYALVLAPSSQSVGNNVAASLTATLTGGSGSLGASTSGGTLSTTTPTSGVAFTLTTQNTGSGTDTVTVTGPALSNGSLTVTATVAYGGTGASSLTLTGPATGQTGVASNNFTIATDQAPLSNVHITPTSANFRDTFNPSTITLTPSSFSQTFTVTSGSNGTRLVNVTNDAGLSGPTAVAYTTSQLASIGTSVTGVTTGLTGTIGFTVYLADGSTYQVRTTSGIHEIGTSGQYISSFQGLPGIFYFVQWDTGGGSPTFYLDRTVLPAGSGSPGGSVGSGASTANIRTQDQEGNPIGNVECWVSTDSVGANVVAGTLMSDAFGFVTFNLDPGTYYLWRESTQYSFTNPAQFTVT